jgi:phosphoribosylformimino-5-aminoimidazole carboxamide ribotide isomerase
MGEEALTSEFEILVAIDLRGGRVVRLEQGDFERETAFSDDPVRVASDFVDRGARWLHVVDLDGARSGRPAHVDVIAQIVAAAGERARVEVAGGLRDDVAVSQALSSGAARAVVATAALADPAFAGGLIETHGAERIVVALDVRDGVAVGAGWRHGAPGLPAEDALAVLADRGVSAFEVTAIDRDGLLGGPDLELLGRLVDARREAIIASGGIASIDDVAATRAIGCRGAIIGRALYDGTLQLESVLALGDVTT